MKIKTLSDIPAVRDYLVRIGAEPRSLKSAVVREVHGTYWKDLAVIRFAKDGKVDCPVAEYAPTDVESSQIITAFADVQWPQVKPLQSILKAPKMIKSADAKDVFEFRSTDGKIRMVQVRVERDSGKNYVPWTYWDDDQWRMCEPDGALPLYNGHRLKDAQTVFIHEGAKAAKHCQEMVDGLSAQDKDALSKHPWGNELQGAVHVGWIGGAMSPARTDWSVLRKSGVRRAYIVADNDEPGNAAVPAISRQIKLTTFSVQFTNEFPSGFDLADEFPSSMFGSLDGQRYYNGPQFRDCVHPATWATDLIPPDEGKGKPVAVLRDEFKQMWAYVEDIDMFICTEMPEILRSQEILNKMLASFSHVANTAGLINKAYRGRTTRICYRPDEKGLMVTFRGSSAINLHTPTMIRPKQGDAKPWMDFLEYLFINKTEKHEAMRWLATLIAKPELRMGYGMLLISEKQGIGKTTLGSAVLAPLVGEQNVGYPSETDISQSQFNEWVANKRLVVVNEIYTGHSWKAYHALKSVITDKDVTVNQKYMRPYVIENWCHVLASSNSMRALKMENDDRRWFYPELTEVPLSGAKFTEFRRWLDQGGLQIIADWAQGFGDYVGPSDRAPMTRRKRDMIDGSRSEAQTEAFALASSLKDRDEPACLLMKDVVGWVRSNAQGKVFDTDYELRRTMEEAGVSCWPDRVKVAGRLQYAILNDALKDKAQRMPMREQPAAIRQCAIKPTDLLGEQM